MLSSCLDDYSGDADCAFIESSKVFIGLQGVEIVASLPSILHLLHMVPIKEVESGQEGQIVDFIERVSSRYFPKEGQVLQTLVSLLVVDFSVVLEGWGGL